MPSKHTGEGLKVKLDSGQASNLKKVAIGALILGAFAVPVFRSGGRTNLRELEGVEIPMQLLPRSQLERTMTYYRVGEPSARELLSHRCEPGIATWEKCEESILV